MQTLIKTAGACAAAGVAGIAYMRWVEPTWVEVVACDLPVPRLPGAWDGVRVAHISDLHCGPQVPAEYLADAVRRASDLGADLVAATGDFVTTGPEDHYAETAADLLKDLRPPLGTFACLGNHDYGAGRPAAGAKAGLVSAALPQRGVRVLRNDAVRLARGGEDLWVVGLEDLWSGHLDAKAAMRSVPAGAAVLALCHNPDAADAVAAAGCGAILAGHTHGGQVHLPLLGPPLLPVQNRKRYRGLHAVGRGWVYVNRGLGWLIRARLFCRPEITVLTLRRAEEAAAVA